TDNGITTATLGGKIDYSGTGSETLLNTLVATYNQLWITGGSTKSISQSATANGDVNIDPSTTLDFGATASVLNAKADVVNQGTTIGSGTGKIEMNGTALQNMSGNGTYRNLDINNASHVNSTGTPTISSKLNVILGKILQASALDSITLGSTATITETVGGGEHFVRGKLSTTRTVGVAAETFGGMGVELTAGADLGTVIATRQSGIALTSTEPCCTGFTTITRNWVIKPSIQPSTANRDLTLTWHSDDDNSMDVSNMQLWKRSSVATLWTDIGLLQDVSSTNPRVSIWSGVSSFSQFTGADFNNPLPLSLLKFSGRNDNGTGLLNWTMADQKDLKGFRVEKSIDGKNFTDIGTVSPSVDKAAETFYSFTDRNLTRDSYYRIRITHQDGTATVSQVV
ncbi:MAG TPA: hypothetical protein PK509_18605, partial [Catalimonadaceae bacterium]|nr:hypothetical protein [Catalimonadaceae bacterium]